MPHSLRAKLSGLRYKGILEDKDYKRLCHALDLEKAEQEPTDKSNLEKICEELAAENDDLRDQLAMRDRFKQEPCDDAVSRQEVLDTISELNAISFYEAQEDSKECYHEIRQAVEKLQPITPQRKMGRWILSGGYWRCSECKEKALLKLDKSKGGCREYEPVRSKHCPSCGIEMQESEDRK